MGKLSDFRVGEGSAEQALRTDGFDVMFPGSVLSFDQSLASTGWAFIKEGNVITTGMCKTEEPEGMNKTEGKLERVRLLSDQINTVLCAFDPSVIVHELPLVGGAMVRSAESSLMAATALAVMTMMVTPKTPVHAIPSKTMKLHICGKASATKTEVSNAVKAMNPQLHVEKPGPLNEHTLDAIGLAYTYIAQWKEQRYGDR